MKKRVIKIVKRDAVEAPPPEPTAEEVIAQQQKEEAEGDRDMASIISGWIAERRKNNDAEEKDAANSLYALAGDSLLKPSLKRPRRPRKKR